MPELSGLIFVLFVSDLQDWLEHSTAPTYAVDTTTGTSDFSVEVVIKKVEEDAMRVLNYMASNGLVANPKKTSFLILNHKQSDQISSVKIGNDTVTRDSSATLLGLRFQDDLQWKAQIHGKGGVISALKSRFYIIRRLRSNLSMPAILKLVDGLFMSKIRYGLQLYGKVRLTEECPKCENFKVIQKMQNDLLRFLSGNKVSDKVSIKCLLEKFKTISVNQLNAQIKLLEIWKSLNLEDYPLQIRQQEKEENVATTRAAARGRPIAIGRSTLTQSSCVSDAIKLWNSAPSDVTDSLTIYRAKTQIKKFVKTLPI